MCSIETLFSLCLKKKKSVKEIKFFFPIFYSWGKVSSELMAMVLLPRKKEELISGVDTKPRD